MTRAPLFLALLDQTPWWESLENLFSNPWEKFSLLEYLCSGSQLAAHLRSGRNLVTKGTNNTNFGQKSMPGTFLWIAGIRLSFLPKRLTLIIEKDKAALPPVFVPQFGKDGIITGDSSGVPDSGCTSANTRAGKNLFHTSKKFKHQNLLKVHCNNIFYLTKSPTNLKYCKRIP